jgi:hypothetical protein
LNLQKAFENRKDRLWSVFKNGGCCTARFSKEHCLIGKIFDRFKNRRFSSGQLSKALSAAPRKLLSNRSKGFELASFEKFLAWSVAFHAEGLRIY